MLISIKIFFYFFIIYINFTVSETSQILNSFNYGFS